MSKQTEVVISARCGAAARDGINEDNCLVMKSVGKQNSKINHFGDGEYISKVFPLERNGSLLVVADGMGGMNAGEVASAIAIETIANVFKSDSIDKMELTERNIKGFMLDAIREADEAIKKDAISNPGKEGMGTTIVILWVFKDYAYYAWCGDSRLYHYHDRHLFQLSHDHSYVCEILGLSETEAFDHPDNNIITRSLGSPNDTCRPDVCGPLKYHQGDLFLLCSDGLSGVVRNFEIEEALQYAVDNHDKLNLGNLSLWQLAENNHWYDNVTSLLCYIHSAENAVEVKKEVPEIAVVTSSFGKHKKNKSYKIIALLVTVVVVLLSLFLLWFFSKTDAPSRHSNVDTKNDIQTSDSVFKEGEDSYEYDETESDMGGKAENSSRGKNCNNAKGTDNQNVNGTSPKLSDSVEQPVYNPREKGNPTSDTRNGESVKASGTQAKNVSAKNPGNSEEKEGMFQDK